MNDWKKKFCAVSDEMRLLLCEIKSGPVTNDVARVVIDSTRNLFLLAVDKTTLHRYTMKPMEVLDLCPQSTVTTLFLDELLVSMKMAGFQTGKHRDNFICEFKSEAPESSEVNETVTIDFSIESDSETRETLKNKVCPKVVDNRVCPKDLKSKVGSRVINKSFEPEVIECKSEVESEDDSVELTDDILVILKKDCDPSDSQVSVIEAHIANNKTCLHTAADTVSSAKKNVNTATSSTEIKNDETNEIIDKTMKAAKSRRIYLLGKRFVVEIDESPSDTKKQCITDIGLNSNSSSNKESTETNIQTSPEKRNLFESMTIESAEQAVTKSNTRLSVVTRARSAKTDKIVRPNYTDPDSDIDDGISKSREGDENPAETDSLSRSIKPDVMAEAPVPSTSTSIIDQPGPFPTLLEDVAIKLPMDRCQCIACGSSFSRIFGLRRHLVYRHGLPLSSTHGFAWALRTYFS